MKIIDLLNKVANGEEVPKKIKYGNEILYYDSEDNEDNCYNATFNYYNKEGNHPLFTDNISLDLNEEVEIIEDNKMIEKLVLNNCDVWTGKTDTDLIVDKIMK